MPARMHGPIIEKHGKIQKNSQNSKRGAAILRIQRSFWRNTAGCDPSCSPNSGIFRRGKEWRYKTNALNAMLNNYDPKYLPVIKKVCQDEYREVRDMAEWVLEEIERKGIGESENGQ